MIRKNKLSAERTLKIALGTKNLKSSGMNIEGRGIHIKNLIAQLFQTHSQT
jgi:hypothetical protein